MIHSPWEGVPGFLHATEPQEMYIEARVTSVCWCPVLELGVGLFNASLNYTVKTHLRKQQNNQNNTLVGKGTCHQAQWPKLDTLDPHGRQGLTNCFLTSMCVLVV